MIWDWKKTAYLKKKNVTTGWAPHLKMSPKRFTMATIALLSLRLLSSHPLVSSGFCLCFVWKIRWIIKKCFCLYYNLWIMHTVATTWYYILSVTGKIVMLTIRLNEWVSECRCTWVNEWVSEQNKIVIWTIRLNKRVSECMCTWVNESVNRIRLWYWPLDWRSEWVSECMCTQMNEWIGEQIDEGLCVQWMNEQVLLSLRHESFILCVKVSIPLINPKKQAKKKNYTNSGILLISSCKVSL